MPAKRVVAERHVDVLGARVRMHVDQAGQQPSAIDDEIRAGDGVGP
ncbi:hypothetical protein [Streptomyces antimycoticus]|nr:hypothetical protein [Streptomyces antimycoticus]